MELQFEVACIITVNYLVDCMGEEEKDCTFHNETITINKKGKNWNLGHTVSNKIMKDLLHSTVEDMGEYDVKTITIKDKIGVSDNNIIFTVVLEEDFNSYHPDMLDDLIRAFNGVITKTHVGKISTAFDTSNIICYISPINPNFAEVRSLLKDNFDNISISLGDTINQPPHTFNYITISGKFNEDYRKRTFEELSALLATKF